MRTILFILNNHSDIIHLIRFALSLALSQSLLVLVANHLTSHLLTYG